MLCPLFMRHLYLLAAAVTAVVAVAGLWFYQANPAFPGNPEVAGQGRVVSVSGQGYVSLPDGSTVILKDGSTLRYRESFGDESRQLTLTGQPQPAEEIG